MENQEDKTIPPNEANEPAMPGNYSKKKNLFQVIKNNPVIITIIIGLIAITGVYFWKDIQGKKQKAAIEKMASEQLLLNNVEMLKVLVKPLIWSIRSEMLRGNMEQVNIFTTDMVKEKNFQFIHLIDPKGIFIVSTDKKMEGQPVNGMFDVNLMQTDSVLVISKEENMLTLAAPVMGYDKRLATIIMNYSHMKFNPEQSKEEKNK